MAELSTTVDLDEDPKFTPPDPPADFCPLLTIVPVFEVNGTITATPLTNDIEYETTSVDPSQLIAGSGQEFDIQDKRVPLQIIVADANVRDSMTFVALGIGDAFAGIGNPLIIILGDGSPNSASFMDFSMSPIGPTFTIASFPYVGFLYADGSNDETRYTDSEGNDFLVGVSAIPLDGATSNFLIGAAPKSGAIGNTINESVNAGSSPYDSSLTLPSDLTNFCDLPVPPPFYGQIEFVAVGGTHTLSNDDRTLNLSYISGSTPFGFYTLNKSITSPAFAWTQNAFELVCDSDSPSDEVNEMALGAVALIAGNTQTSIAIEKRDEDTYHLEFVFQTVDVAGADNVFRFAAGITTAIGARFLSVMIDNGINAPLIQFGFQLPSQPVVWFPPMPTEVTGGLNSPKIMADIFTMDFSAPSGAEIQNTYNGEEDDYVVATYPAGTVDSNGGAMPSKVAGAYAPTAHFELNPQDDSDDGVVEVTANSVFTITDTGTIATVNQWAWSSSCIGIGSGVRAIEMVCTDQGAIADAGQIIAFRSMQREQTFLTVHKVGNDLVAEFILVFASITVSDIKTNYIPADGDRFGIAYDTDNKGYRGYLLDSTNTLYKSALISVTAFDNEFYMPIIGVKDTVANADKVFTSALKSANMASLTKAEYNADFPAGVTDIQDGAV
jgi:hypothetical protein